MIILGVDPGASGALAVIRDGEVHDLFDMPTGEILVGKTKRKRVSPQMLAYEIRKVCPIDVAYVEEVTAMPKQGVSSVFTFGQAHGLVLGVIAGLGIRTVRVRPQTWQQKVKARGDPRPRACELYPETVGDLTRKKDDGRADSILLAHYGRIMEGEINEP